MNYEFFNPESKSESESEAILQQNKVINVLVNLRRDTPKNSTLAFKIPNESGYQGVLYDIWKLVREKLQSKYTFVEHFKSYSNYDQMTESVSDGKYDIVIAPFTITTKRMKIVNFTDTVILNRHTILHLPKLSMKDTIKTVIQKVIIGPLLVAICIGIVLGLILHWFEPNRYVKARVKKPFALRRTISTVIASLFGEAGFLSENSTLSIAGIVIVFFILIFAFFFVMLLQAVVTERVIDLKKDKAFTTDNLNNQLLLSPKGYAAGIFMQRYGANIEYHDKPIKEIIDIYLKNKNKYSGISLDIFDATSHASKKNNMVTSKSDFGFTGQSWVISKQYPELLHEINTVLAPIRFNLHPYYICKKYLNISQVYLCNL